MPAYDDHLILFEPQHGDRAVELMYWQHREKPRLQALVRALAKGAQLLEDTIWAVIIGSTTIAGAEGANLDRWGRLVGEERGDLDEADYRRFIGLRVRVNTEFQNEDATYEILSGAAYPYPVSRNLVADGLIWVVQSDDWLDDSVMAHTGALIRDFRAAGMYAAVVEQVPAVEFRLGSVAEPGTTFGSIADPGDSVLGRLIYNGRGR